MTDSNPVEPYADQAKRLRKITGLLPVQVLSDRLAPHLSIIVAAWPPHDEAGHPRLGRVVGIRLFNGPREVVIESVTLNGYSTLAGPFDAAAYALENPMLPLENPIDENYRGEPLRFCAVNWGVISRERPLCILVKSWQTPSQWPRLYGYIVCELEDPEPGGPYRKSPLP